MFTAFLTSQMMNILASNNDSNLMTLDVTYSVYPMKNIMLLQQSSAKPEGEDIGEWNW